MEKNEPPRHKRYRQRIHVGRHATDIMRLACVFSVHKQGDGTYCYLLYDWDCFGNYTEAHEGDWLCEDYAGKWHVEQSEHSE